MTIKKIVEAICCDFNRNTLEDICEFYYRAYNRSVKKAKRGELEQIVYIIMVLNIDPAGIYEIQTANRVIHKSITAAKLIRYILRSTIFNWYEESEYPITRDQWQTRVTVKRIGMRTI